MIKSNTYIEIKNTEYYIKELLGKGKGGFTYLAECNNQQVAVKQIHYEKCDYYTFEDNKLESELRDYHILVDIGIAIPKLISYDNEKQLIVKELLYGTTAAEWIAKGEVKDTHIKQIFEMCDILYNNNLNIDYFPTNFMEKEQKLYYVDYECNPYMEEWNFENWGIWFYANVNGFEEFVRKGNHECLLHNGKPKRIGFEGIINRWMEINSIK